MERDQSRFKFKHPRCPYCHDVVAKGIKPQVCSECHALHHAECWESHGACSACGAADSESATAASTASRNSPSPERPALAGSNAELVQAATRLQLSTAPATKLASQFMLLIGLANIALFSVLAIWWGDAEFRLMCQFWVLAGVGLLGLAWKFRNDAQREESSPTTQAHKA